MVDFTPWEKRINKMVEFYVGLEKVVTNEADRFSAELAKDSCLRISDLIEKYKSDPRDQYLKQIHANIMTLTRGVEGFIDSNADRQHNGYGDLQYEILECIRNNVQW